MVDKVSSNHSYKTQSFFTCATSDIMQSQTRTIL